VSALGQEVIEGAKPEDDDLILWSVTTIIGCLDKPALMYWAAEQTALAAVHSHRTWQAMLDDDHDACAHDSAADCAAVKWLRDARFRRPKDTLSAAELGTAFHKAVETWTLHDRRPQADELADLVISVGSKSVNVADEVTVVEAMLVQFDRWAKIARPGYDATEVVVYSPTYGYAGTADFFLTLDGVPLIGDYKTSRASTDSKGEAKSPYPEVALQLSAYRFAEAAAVWRPRRHERMRRRYYLLSPEERAQAVAVPEVDGGVCIHVTPGSCDAFPVRCDESVHRSFLYIQEAARWQFEVSKNVIGQPLVFDGPAVREVA
jgi:hypothetical protein